MSESDYKKYLEKLYRTNLTFFERAVEKAKFGKKGNKVGREQLRGIHDTISEMRIKIE